MQDHQPQDLIAFFDTETSGIPEWKMPSDDPKQPHLAEVAGLLYTTEGVLVDRWNVYVAPDGWIIHPDALAIHGLTQEFLELNGIAERHAVDGLVKLIQRAGTRVAHNRTFDDRLVRIALKRFYGSEKADAFKEHPQKGEDTALLAKPLCKLPATEAMQKTNLKNSYKTPTLAEAFRHLTGGKELEGAHSAIKDAEACARVYFLIKGVRMPDFPHDAEVLREELDHLPHGKDECDAAQSVLLATTQE